MTIWLEHAAARQPNLSMDTVSSFLASTAQSIDGTTAAIASGVAVGAYAGWSWLHNRCLDAEYYVPTAERPAGGWKHIGKGDVKSVEDIPGYIEEYRTSFYMGNSRPYAKRIQQLTALVSILERHGEDIKEALHQDLGRPEFEALMYDIAIPISEIKHMIACLRQWMRPTKKGFNLLTFPSSQYIQKEPFGVALVISTWNYPIMLSILPLAGAIAGGNVALLKPSNVSPATAALMGRLLTKYMDPEVVGVIGYSFDGDREVNGALLDQKLDNIFFTGGPTVGRIVMEKAAKHLTPVTLELGGKNPVIVAADADIRLAAKRIVCVHTVRFVCASLEFSLSRCQRDRALSGLLFVQI